MKRFLSLLAATVLVSLVAAPALAQAVLPVPSYYETPLSFIANYNTDKIISTTAPVGIRQLGGAPFSSILADTTIGLCIANSWARMQSRTAVVTSAADSVPLGYLQVDALDANVDTIGVVIQTSPNGVTWTAVDSLNFGPTATFVLGDTTQVTPAPASGTGTSSGRVYLWSFPAMADAAILGRSRASAWANANFVRAVCRRDYSTASSGARGAGQYALKFGLYTADPNWATR